MRGREREEVRVASSIVGTCSHEDHRCTIIEQGSVAVACVGSF